MFGTSEISQSSFRTSLFFIIYKRIKGSQPYFVIFSEKKQEQYFHVCRCFFISAEIFVLKKMPILAQCAPHMYLQKKFYNKDTISALNYEILQFVFHSLFPF